jgi:hypothetical protein
VRGVSDFGGAATFNILSLQENKLVVNEGWLYDEEEQVTYLKELFAVFAASGTDFVFWFTFADYEKLYSTIMRQNLDMASYGVVKMLGHGGKTYPEMQWEPRKAFWALGQI